MCVFPSALLLFRGPSIFNPGHPPTLPRTLCNERPVDCATCGPPAPGLNHAGPERATRTCKRQKKKKEEKKKERRDEDKKKKGNQLETRLLARDQLTPP